MSCAAERRNFVRGDNIGGKLSDPPERHMLDALVVPGRTTKPSSNERDRSACSCLRKLADHLCHLNMIEHKHESICLDTTLSETDSTRNCAESVLECHRCRFDLKVALLMTTVLQTALDLLSVGLRHKTYMQQLPTVLFGTWRVPESDAIFIKKLLMYRILTTSDAVVNNLRLRIDEITLKASKQSMSSKFMDAEFLQQALRRLAESLGELVQYVKH